MKTLEQDFDKPTQDILLKTVRSIAPAAGSQQRVQWDTLTKFLSKTNVKLGGLNYQLRLEDKKL